MQNEYIYILNLIPYKIKKRVSGDMFIYCWGRFDKLFTVKKRSNKFQRMSIRTKRTL